MEHYDRYSPAAELRARIDRAQEEGYRVETVIAVGSRSTQYTERATSLQVKELTSEFRRRSRAHRFMAFGAQGLITLSIFGGIYIFGFAGQIAAEERRTLVDIGAQTVAASRKLREQAENELSRANSDLKSMQASQAPSETEIERLKRKASAETANIAASQEAEAQALKQMTAFSGSHDQTILTITTKIGSVLLLLFFVKVLVSIFRYYSRLSIFYDSRADAFASYTSLSPMTLLELSTLISPDSLDFEKSPDSPEPPSLTLIKELAALRGKSGA